MTFFSSQVLVGSWDQKVSKTMIRSVSIMCLGKWPEIAFGVIKQTYVPTICQALMQLGSAGLGFMMRPK